MTSQPWKVLFHFWATDRGLSIFLGLLILIIFLLPTVATPSPVSRLAADVAFSLLLIAGVTTLPEQRWMQFVVPPLVMLALIVRWASVAISPALLAPWREIFSLATLALFVIVVGGRVYRPGPVTRERIQGSVAIYLLLGLAWASAYELLHILRPGAWTGPASEAPGSQTWIYYSFITLTTVGYGDITPVHPVGRSLAILEALTGQLYLAITLARLVALHIKSGEQG